MRTGISITLTSSDRHRLEALTSNRNTAQKHVWRADVVLLTADRHGTAVHDLRRNPAVRAATSAFPRFRQLHPQQQTRRSGGLEGSTCEGLQTPADRERRGRC